MISGAQNYQLLADQNVAKIDVFGNKTDLIPLPKITSFWQMKMVTKTRIL